MGIESEEKYEIEYFVKPPDGHSLKRLESEYYGASKGQDVDRYLYALLDADGKEVKRYVLKDSMGTFPPFARHAEVEEVSLTYELPKRR
ncbi:hypothetical protein [Delftia deserti]|uniref:Uncharacterized protein n=1 Tax=Delftia deserti TaxID=1651218 RepID=A0ABW5EWW4_9BURK